MTPCKHPREYRRQTDDGVVCGVCMREIDTLVIKRGRTNRSRGISIERWVCRMLGITRVGHFGGKADGGTDAEWIRVSVKSGGAYPERLDRWLRSIPGEGLKGVVITDTPGPGHRRRALLVVDLYQASEQWGGGVSEEEAA